ncbi:MAG: hypothetical protein GC160_10440 [Acidobacteria bacterium]|nr:hypothetical protein [Acidobacteriota bacterium]
MTSRDSEYARREQREPVTGAATLSWEIGDRGASGVYHVRNLTADGMQAIGRWHIPPGASVFISGLQYECLAQVRYCHEAGGRFRVGLEFLSPPYRVEAGSLDRPA